jgi:predicted O-linked N-acetylglucosamine transferase (SPINDLY family)
VIRQADDPSHLAKLRSSLRQLMQASPLMDHAALAGNIEKAYQDMWRAWCKDAKKA